MSIKCSWCQDDPNETVCVCIIQRRQWVSDLAREISSVAPLALLLIIRDHPGRHIFSVNEINTNRSYWSLILNGVFNATST